MPRVVAEVALMFPERNIENAPQLGCRRESFSFGNVYAMTGQSFAALGLFAASGHVA